MKKKLCAALLAMAVLVASTSVSLAVGDRDSDKSSIFEPVDSQESITGITTGTQTREKEKEENEPVDEDIREEVEELIPDDIEEIRIGSADDLLAFAKKCNLDTWSANKYVVLTDDIDLLGREFEGIPYFSGIFDGKGHTVSEISITQSLSYAGFFNYIERGAVVKNLNVEGAISPTGDNLIVGGIAGDNSGVIRDCSFKGIVKGSDYIGAIAGMNELSGEISFTRSEGYVGGTHFVGGIAGENMGNIANCTNNAMVNTSISDSGISIDSMEMLNTVINLIKNAKKSDDTALADSTISDVGGIAGLSIGIINRCINNGPIGYDHVGYNIGGIAGRQSGYILSCSNNGQIKGRKDVGGIAGQAEPFITVDLSSDIAYQLSEAISKLHDTVSATLKDAKRQSDTISDRLAVIQKFTAGAVDDTRYIAAGTVDFINGVSGAANATFSRIDYVIDEASKSGGLMDESVSASEDFKDTISGLRETVDDIEILQYLDEGELEDYYRAKNALEIITSQQETLYEMAYTPYYNEYIHRHGNRIASDLMFMSDGEFENLNDSADAYSDITGSDSSSGITLRDGEFVHYNGDDSYDDFPLDDGSEQAEADKKLRKLAKAHAVKKAKDYVKEKYVSPEGYSSNDIAEDMAAATQTVAELTYRHLPDMTEAARSDAEQTVNSFESASSNITGVLRSARDIANGVSDQPDIVVPTLSDEYRAHTTSLADNMQGMNDNFGLLNSEVNNASGVLIDDLQALSDEFNNILMLYTDAIDGVLEKDYTNVFSDESLAEAEYTTDATIDSCLNFGECYGDIDTSGIAGTMAIEYDFDKESQITGLTEGGINTSFITKCVLRNNRNYGRVKGVKDYSGGVCGRQEMGTITGCGSYATVLSEDGNYVGGITGSSLSFILKSFAKGELDGISYVGGIAGDGKNIRDCLSLVTVGSAENWYGAIAGHVYENGEVRNNYFVSDDLAGIDRVSYSFKAEPVSYEDVVGGKVFAGDRGESQSDEARFLNMSTDAGEGATTDTAAKEETATEGSAKEEAALSVPSEFSSLTVTFVLSDDDLEGGSEIVGRISKKYMDSLTPDEYPGIKNKEGFYVSWDQDSIDSLTSDVTINAQYKRYRTTITVDTPKNNVHMSDLLVDGNFKEDDELKILRTVLNREDENSKDDIRYIEELAVTIPDDGNKTHRVRFMPGSEMMDLMENVQKYTNVKVVVYEKTASGLRELTPVGTMGRYNVYELEGNDLDLVYGYKGVNFLGMVIAIAILVILLLIIVGLIVAAVVIRRNHKKARKVITNVKEIVSARIENKEQLFYDDSADKKEKKEKDKKSKKSKSKKDKEVKVVKENKETKED